MDEVRKLSDSINEELRDYDRSEQIPDSLLEGRFSSLCLAFRTDRLTLEKRLGIQESSRDLAEQNVEKELHSLRDAVQLLKQLCGQDKAQEVLVKMGHHVDVLEHSIARVSTRAEVLGAVQQEKRMSLAMEVMISYTESLRRLRDKELLQLESARKVLSEKRLTSGRSFESLSQTGTNNIKAFRRRSEVALPRILGGGGLSSLQFSSRMEEQGTADPYRAVPSVCGASLEGPRGATEPKQRFQTATANIGVRNLVAATLRHSSFERQNRLPLHHSSCSSTSSSTASASSVSASGAAVSASGAGASIESVMLEGRPPKRGEADTMAARATVTREGAYNNDSLPKAEVAPDFGDKDQAGQHHVSTHFPTNKTPAHGRELMDTPQRREDPRQPSSEDDSPPSASRSSPPLLSQQETQDAKWQLQRTSYLPADVTWRHVIAGVIFTVAMAVLVVTFSLSLNVT